MIEAFLRKPARVREEALRRTQACLEVRRLVGAGLPVRRAVPAAAQALGIAPGTLARWWFGGGRLPGVAGCENVAAWPALLAPAWGETRREAPFSPAAWDALLRDWLRPERPSLRAVYRRLTAAAPAQGWQVPSFATVARRVARLDVRLTTLAREGRQAFERLFAPLKRSVAHLQALEWVNADGHRLDVFAQLPERFGGGVGRPHLIAWQDVYSRKILAWRLTPTLNAYAVVLSFADLVEAFGIPEHALFDNGREFGAKCITGGTPWRFRFKTSADEMLGVLPLLGVEVHWASPFHGQAKPIERAFRDLAEEIAKDPRLAGAYTGNRPEAKPENYGSRAVAWEALEEVAAQAIARHNARTGRRTETARGRSFDETFAESFAQRAVRRLSPAQRGWLLLASEPVQVRQNHCFELAGNVYGVRPEWGLAGRRVVARFDPDRLSRPPLVFTLDGALVGEAETRVARFDDQAAAQAHRRHLAAQRRAVRQRLRAIEALELIESAAARPAGPAQPAAVEVVRLPLRPQAQAQEEAQAQRWSAGVDALVLELSERLARAG
ncbi:MAG: transposase domain-containing protein [Acetobacteraceae bacterium]|nr:transposase domain-containing protein [Acetobacteraceae bacterium]